MIENSTGSWWREISLEGTLRRQQRQIKRVFRQGAKSWKRRIHHVNHACQSQWSQRDILNLITTTTIQILTKERLHTQAKWIKDLSELPLRASDVIRLVKRGREYQTGKKTLSWLSAFHRSVQLCTTWILLANCTSIFITAETVSYLAAFFLATMYFILKKWVFSAHHGAIPVPWHQPILPALRPHKRLLLRYKETPKDKNYFE